jgi:hypothetical protein
MWWGEGGGGGVITDLSLGARGRLVPPAPATAHHAPAEAAQESWGTDGQMRVTSDQLSRSW